MAKTNFPPDRAPLVLSFEEFSLLRVLVNRRVSEISDTLANPKRTLEATSRALYVQQDIARRPKAYAKSLKNYRSIAKKLQRI